MIKIKKGLDIPIAGEPLQQIVNSLATQKVGVLGGDYIGLKPTMKVSVGDQVQQGQALFEDKKNPGVIITAPIAGTVAEINRGERRAFLSLVIERDDSFGSRQFTPIKEISTLDQESIRKQLQESGEWTALRTRPYGKIPAVASEPDAIFVNAMDSNPLAVDPEVVLKTQLDDFLLGLAIVSKLTSGTVYVCSEPTLELATQTLDKETQSKLQHKTFTGPHPSGLAGTHIHFLYPVGVNRNVWTINYQDTIAYGKLFKEGRLSSTRCIALAGPQVIKPRLLQADIGSDLEQLTSGQLQGGDNRIISGSVLSGAEAVPKQSYLGRFHHQICVLQEGNERPFLHYMLAGRNRYSSKPIYISHYTKKRKWKFTTTTNGSPRAMVPIGSYEEVFPLDLLPTQLLRSLIIGDTEKAQKLGCLELVEEDLSLCTFVCPSKYEFGPILRGNLTRIELEG